MKNFNIKSNYDEHIIYGDIIEPKSKPIGVVQISHGMAENKERYYDFMNFLANNGYVAVIHNHRGHGMEVKNDDDFGYFGNNKDILEEELYEVTKYIKSKYKSLDIILFGHSMGSLIARRYIQNHDNEISKLILCGAPTYNPFSRVGSFVANIVGILKGDRYRSKFINNLVFGSYNKDFDISNAWICANEDTVNDYNNSKYCGFIFTINGFKMLFYMMRTVFNKKLYKIQKESFPLLIIGGADDPVIGGENKFNHLCNFLYKAGYKNIRSKLYKNMRHEILNEKDNKKVYKDILKFINTK